MTGQDKTGETVKLAKMNLLINGLKGEIKKANTFKNDLDYIGQYDYVMANPPLMLNKSGRAALVMPNSASNARHSEQDIRIRLIEKGGST